MKRCPRGRRERQINNLRFSSTITTERRYKARSHHRIPTQASITGKMMEAKYFSCALEVDKKTRDKLFRARTVLANAVNDPQKENPAPDIPSHQRP
jgi:hypothetical protein